MAPMSTGEVEQQKPTKPSKWYFRTACSINGDDLAPKITFLYLCSSISPWGLRHKKQQPLKSFCLKRQLQKSFLKMTQDTDLANTEAEKYSPQ